jgi:hypothetical protein
MKHLKLNIAIICTLLSTNINAALIDNGDYTTDDVSGLDWLDLSISNTQPYDQATALNPGWRFATSNEVVDMFNVAFEGFYPTNSYGTSVVTQFQPDAAYADQYIDVVAFESLFGITSYNSEARMALGWYMDSTGSMQILGTGRATYGNEDETVIYGPEYTGGYPYGYTPASDSFVGSFLVRTTTVPVPAAGWLFVAGILSFLGFVRRSHRPDSNL